MPDSEAIRRRVQQQFKTASWEAFDLLAAVGRDCVGAVQLLPLDETPADITRIEARPLDDAAVERALIHATAASAWASKRGTWSKNWSARCHRPSRPWRRTCRRGFRKMWRMRFWAGCGDRRSGLDKVFDLEPALKHTFSIAGSNHLASLLNAH
jgi:hypothetical protein